jgi:hypothetical protein
MNDRLAALVAWLREPSTVRGLVTLAGGFGIAVSPDLLAGIVATVMAITGMINTVRREK